MKCDVCGSIMNPPHPEVLSNYAGLAGVSVHGVLVCTCPGCDNYVRTIPRLASLHRRIAEAVVRKETALTGAEFRFLRKQIGWSTEDVATNLNASQESVLTWESDEVRIPAFAEENMRRWAIERPKVDSYGPPPTPLQLSLTATQEGWESIAAK